MRSELLYALCALAAFLIPMGVAGLRGLECTQEQKKGARRT